MRLSYTLSIDIKVWRQTLQIPLKNAHSSSLPGWIEVTVTVMEAH